jgi:hypothetical protein
MGTAWEKIDKRTCGIFRFCLNRLAPDLVRGAERRGQTLFGLQITARTDTEGQQKLRQEQRDWIRRRDTLLHDSPRQTVVSLAVAETGKRLLEFEAEKAGQGYFT